MQVTTDNVLFMVVQVLFANKVNARVLKYILRILDAAIFQNNQQKNDYNEFL